MSLSVDKARKIAATGLAALTLVASSAAVTTPAQAAPGHGFHGGAGFAHGGFRTGPGFYGRRHSGGRHLVPGIVGGLALGALAGSAYYGAYGACHIEGRRAYDPFGNVFYRNVRVCY